MAEILAELAVGLGARGWAIKLGLIDAVLAPATAPSPRVHPRTAQIRQDSGD